MARANARMPRAVAAGKRHGNRAESFLRGHTRSLLDLTDEPEKSAALLAHLAGIFCELAHEVWKRVPLFHGGYFDAQFSLWSPGPILRMQEDATAGYSPPLYRRLVQPVDRWIAGQFDNSFMHLHSTSMFLLEAFLEIEEIRCFQVNIDVSGPTVNEMVPFFEAIQKADRSLIVRGSPTPDELAMLLDALDPRGLYYYLMVRDSAEIDALRAV